MKEEKKQLIDEAKKKLWMFGYGVRDFSDIADTEYDLLITCGEKEYRAIVTPEAPENIEKGIDAYITKEHGMIVFVFKAAGIIKKTSPYDAFGRPPKQTKINKRFKN